MSQSPQPPAGGTPRVHHPGPTGAKGPTGQAAPAGDPIGPDDYRLPIIAAYSLGRMPDRIVYTEGGQPEAAPAAAGPPREPQPVFTASQAVQQACAKVQDAFDHHPELIWEAIGGLINLGLLTDGINPRLQRVGMPYNRDQVIAGGVSVIKAAETDRKAKSLEIDVDGMGQDVGAALRINRALEVLQPAYRAVDANQTVVLNRVADRVDQVLSVGGLMIKSDGILQWKFGPALAIRGGPAAAAVSTRAEHARTEEAIRADERAKMPGEPAPPQQTTTTVTTQAPLPAVALPAKPAPTDKKK